MTAVEPTACTVRRVLAAPPETIFRVWTDPALAAQWSWGKEYETQSVELECRPGGVWNQHIRNTTTGENWFFEGVFREVVPNRRLVHTFRWHSDRGENDAPSLVAIDFLPHGDQTEVVITHTQLAAGKVAGTEKGWTDVLACVDRVTARVVGRR